MSSDTKKTRELQSQGWSPTNRVIVLVSLLFIGTLVTLGFYLLQTEERLVESTALHDAEQYSDAISEFRTLYTSEVVERVRGVGIEVTHDYLERENSIPLPATMSILLGNRITRTTGGTVRLYSDAPFKWREATRAPLDPFELDALASLRRTPNEPVYSFEGYEGQPSIRYATADLMRPDCVECHNNHDDSPRRDWKTGDVRGVLEVIRPVNADAHNAHISIRRTVGIFIAAGVLGLLALALFAWKLRRSSLHAGAMAVEAIEMADSLELHIEQRDMAEEEAISLREQVQYAQKLESLGLLAGGVAHDFNNVLTAICGNATLAQRKLDEGHPALMYLDRVMQGGSRAQRLTEQLLVYAGKGTADLDHVDMVDTVLAMLNLLGVSVPEGVKVQTNFKFDIAHVLADKSALEQLVTNLFTNAAESIESGVGEVNVKLEMVDVDSTQCTDLQQWDWSISPGPHVLFEVSDTGVGMSAETLERIYDPFYSTKGAGRGLGLSAISGIVRNHHGALTVDSEPGEGTCFSVLLPVASGESKEESEQVGLFVSVRSDFLVYVVDDDEDVRLSTAEQLREVGWEVKDYSRGKQAYEAMASQTESSLFVVLDMAMPEWTGEETLKYIRSQYPTMPVLLISGHVSAEVTGPLTEEPYTGFLRKPYNIDDLEMAMWDLVAFSHRAEHVDGRRE